MAVQQQGKKQAKKEKKKQKDLDKKFADDEQKNIPFISGVSFNEYLKNQLQTFSFNKSDIEITSPFNGTLSNLFIK